MVFGKYSVSVYDAVILILVLAMAIVVVKDHYGIKEATQRIVLPGPGGKGASVYDAAALQRILDDLKIRDEIDLELDHSWVELYALKNAEVTRILQFHNQKIKDLQTRLK